MKTLQYLYYRLYLLMVSVGNGDVAEFFSVLLLTMMFYLNYYSIIGFLYAFFGIKIDVSILALFIFGLSTCLILYFLLVSRGKSNSIIAQFEDEDESKKKTGRIIIISYIILNVLIFMVSILLMAKRNNEVH